MTNVVAFKPDQRGRAVEDHGAERGRILLFTGIRYLRDEEPEGEDTAVRILAGPAADDDTAAAERLKA